MSSGDAIGARRTLADALGTVLGETVGRSEITGGSREAVRSALSECPMGVAAALRVLALAHFADPLVLHASKAVQIAALDIALRFQQLASGWLIYCFNEHAKHNLAFIDDSDWPINSDEFGDEQRMVQSMLANLRTDPIARPFVPKEYKLPGLSLAIVTVCAYPKGSTPLPNLAASIHQIYATRHGYAYIHHRDASISAGRPPAWGKIPAIEEALKDGRWDWVLWVDCDLYFMDLNTTLDSLLVRYASKSDGEEVSLDANANLLLTEDSQMLNTAIFFIKRSQWSLDLLRRVWAGEDDKGSQKIVEEDLTKSSLESPFVNHTWWEQAAFAQELLGANYRRFAELSYHDGGSSDFNGPSKVSGYPPQVKLIPQAEMNSYHPVSSRLIHETWSPGKFVISFNGVQGLSAPMVTRVLHANYFDVFCKLNSVEDLCDSAISEDDEADLFMPWLKA
eukprot:TRINITY_DN12974_c0_g2_i2.p1 TRINITY_DN12974_c0_g2~~TRINITY_DN12974_c0_g2_i2.p1  ORF type:complete len:451 (-),score=64.12 TRINITY_DN12974_c0_g2_i2:359-1711(-)